MGRVYTQLKLEEREQMMCLRSGGKSFREIAEVLGRHHTTISREFKRFTRPKKYWPSVAQAVSERRKQEAGRRTRLKSDRVREYVREKLITGWSPEQIAGRISLDEPLLSVSHEAIYQWVYSDAEELISYLPRHARKRQDRSSVRAKRVLIPNRTNIGMRPLEVSERRVFGHWEADLMVSRQSKAVLQVLVERMSRYVKLTKLPGSTPLHTREAIVRRLLREKRSARLSITYDNGIENRDHELINQKLKTKSYFCNPYHSWEKGTVENTAGLVRRFAPKRTDFAKIPNAWIKRIEDSINNRPRKCLQYQTPKEMFQSLSGALPG